MDTTDILRLRLRSQLIAGSTAVTPLDVVSRLLGMQAQDYLGALWAVGVRLPGSTVADIERALAEGSIVRTWPMRGTLHFIAAEDVRWMLPLLTPRRLASAEKRERDLQLDSATFSRAGELFSAALEGGRRLTRPDAMALLETDGISTDGQRGYHILWRLAQEGLLVLGPVEGKQQTFVLLDEWLPAETPTTVSRDELLARLAARYLEGHGPATVDDLARWAGIPRGAAKAAVAAVADGFESARCDGEQYWFAAGVADAAMSLRSRDVHLLPGFDEYMLGYTGRSHQLGEHLAEYGSQVASNGMLAATVVIDGRAVGVWKRKTKARAVDITVWPFRTLTVSEIHRLSKTAQRYGQFLGLTASVEVAGR